MHGKLLLSAEPLAGVSQSGSWNLRRKTGKCRSSEEAAELGLEMVLNILLPLQPRCRAAGERHLAVPGPLRLCTRHREGGDLVEDRDGAPGGCPHCPTTTTFTEFSLLRAAGTHFL